jgi:hypothetical protein
MITVPVLPPKVNDDFVALPLDLSSIPLPPRLAFAFVKREEFHVTLVGSGHGLSKKVANDWGLDSLEAKSQVAAFCRRSLVESNFKATLMPVFFSVEKAYEYPIQHTRRSVAALCAVSGVDDFYLRLSDWLRFKVEPPPFHVTLYTLEDEMSKRGIGLVTKEELYAHGKPFVDPVLEKAFRVSASA